MNYEHSGRVYVCMWACMIMRVCIQEHLHTCTQCMRVHTYLPVCICVYICVYVYLCKAVCVSVCVHACEFNYSCACHPLRDGHVGEAYVQPVE